MKITDSDVYRSPTRPRWRPRWRWLAFTIIDGREYRRDGWCWTRRRAERKSTEANGWLDQVEAARYGQEVDR